MPFAIQPMLEADIPATVRVELEAFRSHPRIPMLFPKGYTPDVYAYYEDNKIEGYHDDTQRFMEAVNDETGEIVACSEWTFALDPDAMVNKKPINPNEQPPANWPEGGNWRLKRFYKVEWEHWRRGVFGSRPYIELNILVVHPDFHYRGIGAQLMAWGCKQADKLGVAMCLESTPAGVSLYRRFGFEERKVIKADMKEFGWLEPYDEEAAIRVWMVRKARGVPETAM